MSDDILPQIRTPKGALFPEPEDGDTLDITPPPLYWLQVESVSEYRVVIENASGKTVVDQSVFQNYLILRKPLPPGTYRWNILADARQRGWQTFHITPDAIEHIVPTAEEVFAQLPDHHPRHVYYPEDIPSICDRYKSELGVLKRNIQTAIEQGMPPQPRFHRTDAQYADHPRYREAFGDYRDYVDRNLVACALGHLLLTDPQAADYARTAFLDIMDWNPEGPCAVDGPWGDEIGLSNTRCLFAVYDWTHDLYTDTQHGYIQSTLIQYARQIHRLLSHRNFFNDPGNNHAGRIPAYLGEAALVLHGCADLEETRTWLQCALDVYGSFFPHFGGRDGGWAQGTFYGSSYVKWYLPFFFAIERHTGFSFLDRPFYRNLSHFFMHFSPPGWETHPFCDGYWCLPEDEEWPGFFAQDPYGVYAERFGPDVARKFYDINPKPDLFKLHLMDIFRAPFKPAIPNAAGPATQSRAFRDAGFVSIHSDIEHPDTDTAVLARASRFGNVSHMHADQGSFAIISRGKGLITPSGYFGRGAGTNHHRDWTHQTRAHNCILVNNEGQTPHSMFATGKIESLNDEAACAITSLDLINAYPQLTAYKRRILFFRPDLILVCDDLKSETEVQYSWLVHTLSPPEPHGNTIHVSRDPASMDLCLFTHPDPLAFTWTDQFDTDPNAGVPDHLHRHQPNQYHLTWTATPAQNRRFVAVIALNGKQTEIQRQTDTLTIQSDTDQITCHFHPESSHIVQHNNQTIL